MAQHEFAYPIDIIDLAVTVITLSDDSAQPAAAPPSRTTTPERAGRANANGKMTTEVNVQPGTVTETAPPAEKKGALTANQE